MQPTSRARQPELGLAYLLFGLAAAFAVASLTLGSPTLPSSLPRLPTLSDLDIFVRSPSRDQLTGGLALLTWAVWLVWAYVLITTTLRMAVILGERFSEGAAWLSSFRTLSDFVTVGPIRKAVDASLAGALFVRISVGGGAQEMIVMPTSAQVQVYDARAGSQASALRLVNPTQVIHAPDLTDGDVLYTVQPNDSLGKIAERFYGNWTSYTEIQKANLDREQTDGRTLAKTSSVIYPGWRLIIPQPTQAVYTDADGQHWYTVRAGDCLSSISARLLGDEQRYPELFVLNQGTDMVGGRVLTNPNLIWPGLRLRLPEAPVTDAPPTDSEPSDVEPTDAVTTMPTAASPAPQVAADRQDRANHVGPSTSLVSLGDDALPAVLPAPDAVVPPAPPQAPLSNADLPAEPVHRVAPEQAALLAAATAAAALVVGGLVVRRRKRPPLPSGPETDTQIKGGFAEVDPGEDLARRLAGTTGPEATIASLLGQAYVAVFNEELSEDERHGATDGVILAATRHGRRSTTLVLAAPVPARPHLVRCMRQAAERAFGEQVDVDGLVDQNGDVLVRLTWDPRRPVDGRLLEGVGGHAGAWPAPCLVPMIVLRDRQHVAVNWHAIRNVLVAAPAGQGAETVLTALVTSLVSVRVPEDLGLVVIARPHTLPNEIGVFPHGLFDVVDPGDPASVQNALESVRDELDRRRRDRNNGDADLVVVVRELADLESNAVSALSAIATDGPDYGVRLLVASERPVAETLSSCPFADQLGTRLVLQTASEEDSVALLGMPGAEDLGAGGYMLLRVEGRVPLQGLARRVSADHLWRMVHLMGTRAPRGAAPIEETLPDVPAPDAQTAEEAQAAGDFDSLGSSDSGGDALEAHPAGVVTVAWPVGGWSGSPLLRQLRAAPVRVRCFGAREVWCGDRRLHIGDPELLLLLGIHPITGIQSEAVVDALFNEEPTDARRALRQRCFRLRRALRRQVPDLRGDPLPADASHGERVVSLDSTLVSSDVHEFLELLECARRLPREAAIQAYGAALDLYRGDLLDSSDMASYRWMYDEGPQVSLTLCSDYRRLERAARLNLAGLLAEGEMAELARAADLYTSLCAEDPEDERLWTALFRVHERAGSSLGLESAVRRLRAALAELMPEDQDIETVPLPPNLEQLVQQIRGRIGNGAPQAR